MIVYIRGNFFFLFVISTSIVQLNQIWVCVALSILKCVGLSASPAFASEHGKKSIKREIIESEIKHFSSFSRSLIAN